MLHYAAVFFIIAVVAAIFGFGGVAGGGAFVFKILVLICIALAVIALLAGHGE